MFLPIAYWMMFLQKSRVTNCCADPQTLGLRGEEGRVWVLHCHPLQFLTWISNVSYTPIFSRSMPMALREKGMVMLVWFHPGTHLQSKWSSMGMCSSCRDALRQQEYILSSSSPRMFLTVFTPEISLNIFRRTALSVSVTVGGSIRLREKALYVVQEMLGELTSSQLQKLPFSTTALLAKVTISLIPMAVPVPLTSETPFFSHQKAIVTSTLPPKMTMISSPSTSACC